MVPCQMTGVPCVSLEIFLNTNQKGFRHVETVQLTGFPVFPTSVFLNITLANLK